MIRAVPDSASIVRSYRVAATRLAANLGASHPNVTRDAILAGLASGRSIGQTLQDLGLVNATDLEGGYQAWKAFVA